MPAATAIVLLLAVRGLGFAENAPLPEPVQETENAGAEPEKEVQETLPESTNETDVSEKTERLGVKPPPPATDEMDRPSPLADGRSSRESRLFPLWLPVLLLSSGWLMALAGCALIPPAHAAAMAGAGALSLGYFLSADQSANGNDGWAVLGLIVGTWALIAIAGTILGGLTTLSYGATAAVGGLAAALGLSGSLTGPLRMNSRLPRAITMVLAAAALLAGICVGASMFAGAAYAIWLSQAAVALTPRYALAGHIAGPLVYPSLLVAGATGLGVLMALCAGPLVLGALIGMFPPTASNKGA